MGEVLIVIELRLHTSKIIEFFEKKLGKQRHQCRFIQKEYSTSSSVDKIVKPQYLIESLSNNISAHPFTSVFRCVYRDRSLQ